MKDRDQQITERAKKILMRYLGMSEPQAHRFLEQNAMNLRVKKVEIARGVLKMYDLGDD